LLVGLLDIVSLSLLIGRLRFPSGHVKGLESEGSYEFFFYVSSFSFSVLENFSMLILFLMERYCSPIARALIFIFF
jgi:hypothetical protein